MALRTLVHNRWFILFYHVWGPHEQNFIEIAYGWGFGHIWLHIRLEGPWPHYMILEVPWDGLWTLSFGLSRFHGHSSWLVYEVTFRLGATISVVYKKPRPLKMRPSWIHTTTLNRLISVRWRLVLEPIVTQNTKCHLKVQLVLEFPLSLFCIVKVEFH
jgi:hypothetical protein